MLKTIAISAVGLLVLFVAVVVVIASTRPDSFRYQRSANIKAPPEKLFALINDFRQWRSWSPYEKLDPDMKRSYDGAASGKGAGYSWDGDGNVGAGRCEITDVNVPSRIAINLTMTRPFKCDNDVEFTLVPDGVATVVTWGMRGRNTFLSKVMSVFIDMDSMVGGQFEEGLANLKTQAEA